tara:strand:+ start:524 stop:763 length:240 start_codon:yes stop_codon:yes gene_type:complete
MGKGTIRKRITKILEDEPKDTLQIMSELKKYRDCPTTNQLSSILGFYFLKVGEAPSINLGSYHNVKVWTLKHSEQKECI